MMYILYYILSMCIFNFLMIVFFGLDNFKAIQAEKLYLSKGKIGI